MAREKFRRQLQHHQHGLLVRTDQEGAGARGVRRADARDDRPLLRLLGRLALVDEERSLIRHSLRCQAPFGLGDLSQLGLEHVADELPVAVEVARLVILAVQDKGNGAARQVLRERRGVDLLGAGARGICGEEGEFLVLGVLVPRRCRETSNKQKDDPSSQQEGPSTANGLAKPLKKHGKIERGLHSSRVTCSWKQEADSSSAFRPAPCRSRPGASRRR